MDVSFSVVITHEVTGARHIMEWKVRELKLASVDFLLARLQELLGGERDTRFEQAPAPPAVPPRRREPREPGEEQTS